MIYNDMSDKDKANKFDEIMGKKQKRLDKKREERKILRTKWETLENKNLHSMLEQNFPSYTWRLECHLDGMDGRQSVDIVGETKSKDHYICIEVERARGQPVNNFIKVWRYIEENPNSKPIRFIHIFSPYFYAKTGNKRRMDESIFLGKQIEKITSKIAYSWLGQEYWPSDKSAKLDMIIDKISLLLA